METTISLETVRILLSGYLVNMGLDRKVKQIVDYVLIDGGCGMYVEISYISTKSDHLFKAYINLLKYN